MPKAKRELSEDDNFILKLISLAAAAISVAGTGAQTTQVITRARQFEAYVMEGVVED